MFRPAGFRLALIRPVWSRPALLFLVTLPLLWTLPAAAEISVGGRVLEPAGDPLAGARVRLEPLPGSYERARLRLDGKTGPEPVATVTTNDRGAFELQVPEAGMWKVVVEARGRLTMECRLVPLVETVTLPDLALPPAERLEIRLVTAGGEPRPGWVGAQSLDSRGPWRPQLRLATAGPDGKARLPIGPDEKILLEALADGHPLIEQEISENRTVRLELPEGFLRTVRFLGKGRRPVAGVIAVQGSALLPLGRSAEDGRLEVVLQKRDPQPLKALTANLWHGAFELDAEAEDREKRLRLEPPERIQGRVLELETREPVAGAWVWSVRGEYTHTDKRGQYTLERGAHRSSSVRAIAPGFRRGDSRLRDGSDPPAIGLAPTASLSGRVVDGDGRPLEGVVYGPRLGSYSGGFRSASVRRWLYNPRTAQTGADGTFFVAGLPTGVDLELFFEAPDFAPESLEIPPLEPFEKRSGLEVRLGAGFRAMGWVVDSAEVPVPGAEIRLEPAKSGNIRYEWWRHRNGSFDGGDPPLLSNEEGRFEVKDLAAGRYDLSVRATAFASVRVPGLPVGEGPRDVDLGTVVLAPGATLQGRVVDAEGQPITDAQVKTQVSEQGFALDSLESPGPVTTGTDGTFEIHNLIPDQPVSLVASKEDYGSAIVPSVMPPVDEPLEIVLPRAGALRGRVVDPSGRAIEGAVLQAYPDHRHLALLARTVRPFRSLSARTTADGSFHIPGIPPEKLRLSVSAEGYQHQLRSDLQVPAGNEIDVEIVLEPGAVVEGSVSTGDGEPVAEARINIERASGALGENHGSMARGQSDFEGRFRLKGVPVGKVSVNLHAPSGQIVQKSLEVEPGTNFVELVLESGHEVAGQVVDSTRAPVANAAVSVALVKSAMEGSYASGPPEGIVTGADGGFVLRNVGPGDYRVTATREGYARAQSELLEVRADVSGVLLELHQGATLQGKVLGLELDELGTLALYAYGGGGEVQRAELDYSGAYNFPNLASGKWQVHAMVARSGRTVTVQVEIPEGALEVQKDLELGSGYTLSGQVLSGGQPVSGAKVNASGAGHNAIGITNSSGRFQIESLPEGRYHLSISTLGERRPHSEQVELDGDREIRIEIPTGTLAGVVRVAGGSDPLSGAKITLRPVTSTGSHDSDPHLSYFQPESSNFQGQFRFTSLRPGRYRLVVSKSGFGPEEVVTDVGEGAGGPELEIRLSPTEGVGFEVALASGAPLSLVQIAIAAPGSGQVLTLDTHPVHEGRVRVSTVPAGSWDLVVQGGDSAATRFRVTSPGDQGRLLLPPGGNLQVQVPELETEPLAAVALRGPDGLPFVSTRSRSPLGPGQWILHNGQTTFRRLLPGTWTVTVSHRGQTWSGVAEIVAGQTVEVTLP